MSSREVMLDRIRAAVAAGASSTPVSPVPREYQRAGAHPAGSDHVLELLIDRLLDYKAEVSVISSGELANAINVALGGATSVVIPVGLPTDAQAGAGADGRAVVVDGRPRVLSSAELDRIDAVVTAATVAIAVTGTIILSAAEGEGRRAISLVPDLLVVIVRLEQIVETVPDGLRRLDPTAPMTMISGPSATSDIELSRVEGVHGPRTLRVLIVR
jgi:L-lactate dehydrogenase complex protein LldG